MNGWICSPRMYEYKGWIFEDPAFGAPIPLKKNLEPRKRAGNVFYKLYGEFSKLSDNEKKKCRIGGGCQRF